MRAGLRALLRQLNGRESHPETERDHAGSQSCRGRVGHAPRLRSGLRGRRARGASPPSADWSRWERSGSSAKAAIPSTRSSRSVRSQESSADSWSSRVGRASATLGGKDRRRQSGRRGDRRCARVQRRGSAEAARGTAAHLGRLHGAAMGDAARRAAPLRRFTKTRRGTSAASGARSTARRGGAFKSSSPRSTTRGR